MSRHLKTRVLRRLTSSIAKTVPFSPKTPVRSQGVRYLTFVEGIQAYWGAINTVKEGQKYRKNIIVRRCPRYIPIFRYSEIPSLPPSHRFFGAFWTKTANKFAYV